MLCPRICYRTDEGCLLGLWPEAQRLRYVYILGFARIMDAPLTGQRIIKFAMQKFPGVRTAGCKAQEHYDAAIFFFGFCNPWGYERSGFCPRRPYGRCLHPIGCQPDRQIDGDRCSDRQLGRPF
jgi:hypothetical protein